jgi:hypothetical protein
MSCCPSLVEVGGSVSRVAVCRHWTGTEWQAHFNERRRTRPRLPWDTGWRLTSAERGAVLPSLAIFQRGESGTGAHFLAAADRAVDRLGDPNYPAALRSFIAEENTHAALLAEYLQTTGGTLQTREWSDGGFRWLRHQGGLALTIEVLVAAEVIAMAYYAAVRQATGCPVLRSLCHQVLTDEVLHLEFQGQALGRLERGASRWQRRFERLRRAALLWGAGRLVWHTHRPVFRSAGWSWTNYRHRLSRHGQALEQIIARTAQSLQS